MPKKIYIIFISAIALLNFLPVFAAETYTLIVPFSGEETKIGNPADYISRLYDFALIIGGALALAVIAYHAIRYIASAGNSSKQTDAKDGILKAIIGLSLLLGATLLLKTLGVNSLKLELPGVKPKTLVLIKPTVEPEIEAQEAVVETARMEEEKAGKEWGNDSSNIGNLITYTEKQIIHTGARISLNNLELARLYDRNLYLKNVYDPNSAQNLKIIQHNADNIAAEKLKLEGNDKNLTYQKELVEKLKKQQGQTQQ